LTVRKRTTSLTNEPHPIPARRSKFRRVPEMPGAVVSFSRLSHLSVLTPPNALRSYGTNSRPLSSRLTDP
jgi:hypothetical protein